LYRSREGAVMSITASEARRNLFPLIQQVNDDRTVVEIVSRRGNAVLMSADEYAAMEETAHLLRSPENARRLLAAYTDALEGRNLVDRDLSDLEAMSGDA
jgi:antitoxin YefM